MPAARTSSAELDPAIARQFARDGFVIIPGLACPETVQAMRDSAEADLKNRAEPFELEADLSYPGAPDRQDAKGGDTVRRLLRALDRGPAFRDWALGDPVIKRVQLLLGEDDIRLVQAHHNCIMTKHPRFSSATFWHQDIRYWSFEQNELVNCWTALGEETPENGCMRVIPGSHRMGLAPARFDEQKFFRPDLAENQPLIDTAVDCRLSPGDVLFFHSGALHAAGQNTTGVRKLSVVFSYRAADNPPRPGTRSASIPELDPAPGGQTH